MLVGDYLREKREEKGLSLRDVATSTHIRLDYIRDIENSRFEKIPSDIYVKGYLKAYAKVLGLDPDHVLDLYGEDRSDKDDEYEEMIVEPHVTRGYAKKYVYAACAALFLVAALFLLNRSGVIPISDMITGKGVNERSQAGSDVSRKDLRIVTHETTWLMMVIDNIKVEEYILKKGDVLVREGRIGFYIRVGNAGGVTIFLNNRNVGHLGRKGEVVNISIPQGFKLDKTFKDLFQAKRPVK